MSGDEGEIPKPELTDTLPLTETLKIEPPVITVAPEPEPKVVEPFRRKKMAERLRENVVRLRASIPPAQYIPKTKPRTGGLTLRQVSRICFVMALIGYLLLTYVRMRTVAEVNRAVQRSAVKATDSM